MTELKVGPVGFDAAKYACTRWHYSGCTPTGKLIKVGIWEDDRFTGVVIFSRGATPHLPKPYGLTQIECCELTRVAMREHEAPVSQVLAQAIRYLRETNLGMRLIVSFADPEQGHHGGIYQATNWIYAGTMGEKRYFRIHGAVMHPRSVGMKYGKQSLPWIQAHVDPKAEWVLKPGKHRYLFPLDRKMRRQIAPLAMPYPGRAAEASKADAPGFRPGGAGSIPASRSIAGTAS
jgi:hypothetical protein